MFTPIESVILENSSIKFSDSDVISSEAIAPIISSKPRMTVSTTPKISTGVPEDNRTQRTYFSLLLLPWLYSFSWP